MPLRLRRILVATATIVVAFFTSAADAAMKLLVASYSQNSILAYDADTGAPLGNFVPPGSGGLQRPDEIALAPGGGDLYVSPYSYGDPPSGNKIYQYNGQTGAFVRTFTAPTLNSPRGLAFGADGLLYVSSADANSILKFHPLTGAYLGVFATTPFPIGLAFGPDGNLYVANAGAGISRIDGTTGAVMGSFGDPVLDNPQALAFGPDGKLYVHSQYDYRLVQFDALAGTYEKDFYVGSYPYNPSAGMTWGPDGKLYTGNLTNGGPNDGVWRFRADGTFDGHFVPGDRNFNATGVAFTPEPGGCAVAVIAAASSLVMRRPRRTLQQRRALRP